jgi:hypothetical protein
VSNDVEASISLHSVDIPTHTGKAQREEILEPKLKTNEEATFKAHLHEFEHGLVCNYERSKSLENFQDFINSKIMFLPAHKNALNQALFTQLTYGCLTLKTA